LCWCAAKSADELAAKLGLRADGLGHLLRVLAAAGYVARTGDAQPRFELTPVSRATLLADSPARLDAWVLHNEIHWRTLETLEQELSSAGPRSIHHHLASDEQWSIYQRAMLQTARPAATAVANLLPEPATKELLLDLGGSHGLYGAAVCRRFVPMRGRVLDLPEAVEHACSLGEQEGIADLIDYQAADIITADLGQQICDVVFMGNIVHHLDQGQLADLLGRTHQALRPGGVIAIWDMAQPRDGEEYDLVAEGFSLLFFLSSASSCRPPDVHVQALTDAGFADACVLGGPSPTHVLVTAVK
jgi:SAM-dependent methyltransferase